MNGEGKLAVIGVGGNALLPAPDKAGAADQYASVCRLAGQIADLSADGWKLLVTHGNGPQIGLQLRRSELAIAEVEPATMDMAGADVQGSIGYMFARALNNEFRGRGLARRVAALVTQVVVDEKDPAFADPVKPIGSWMSEEEARNMAASLGWQVREDSGRGWRRVVPSPKPTAIVEENVIRDLLGQGCLVVACGGGGIPVVTSSAGRLEGIEVVIDKDLTSAMIAAKLKADVLVLPTGVDRLAVRFNTPEQRWLDRLTLAEAHAMCAENQFAKGSMEPKVRALMNFVEETGGTGIITSLPRMSEALAGKAGTRLVPC